MGKQRKRKRRHDERRQLHSSALATLSAQLANKEEQAALRARIKSEGERVGLRAGVACTSGKRSG